MRKIKFRAWDTENKRMMYSDAVKLDDFFDYVTEGDGSIREWVKLMQFIGLKDKNGIEIYEGDIIKIFNWGFKDKGEIGVVQVFWHDEDIGWRIQPMLIEDVYDLRRALGICEVIGNIYENPELIK